MQKGLLYIAAARIIWVVSGFVIHVAVGRLLGPKLYGVFGVIISLISISYFVLGSSIRQAIARYTASDLKLAGAIKITGLRIQTIFSLMIAGGFVLLSGPIATLLGDDTLASFIKLSALIIPLTGILFVYMGSLEGLKQFAKSATVSVTYASSKMILVLTLVLCGLKVHGAIIGLIFSVFLATLVARHFCRGQPNEGHFDSAVLIKFAVPVSLFFIAIAILMHIDILFAKSILADDTKIGFYTSAQALSRTIYFVFSAFSVILLPSISSAIADNNSQLVKNYINQSLRYMLMLLIPTSFIISATSAQLISLFYSTAYTDAAYPLSILVFGSSFLSITLALSTIMQGYGVPGKPLAILSILAPLDVCLLLVLIPRFELLGAALATSITCFTGLVLSCIYIYKEFKILMSISSLLKIIFASILTYLIATQFSPSGFFLPIYYVGLFVMYVLILVGLKEISSGDMGFVKKIFRKFGVPTIVGEESQP